MLKRAIVLALPLFVSCGLSAADPALDYATSELKKYALKMTGKELDAKLFSLSIDPSLGEQAFRLKTANGKLAISGGDGAGVLYGVYEYLERQCGVRWYSREYEVVPKQRRLPIPRDLDDTQRPAFRMRTADWYDVSHDADFAARLRLNGELLPVEARHGSHRYRFGKGLGSSHTMNSLVDPEKLFHTHPEYFAEWEGKRDWDEHCFTHPDVFRLTLAGVLARIRKDPTARWYGVSQNDTDKHCQCKTCAAVNAEEGSPAGTLVRFVNAIAAEVEKEFPHAVIGTLAYRYSAKPPKKTKLRKNVIPCFCTFECEFANPLATSPLPANRSIAGDIAGWKAMMEKGSDIYVWDYTTCFPNYLMPFPNVKTLRENCRFFRDQGVSCLYEQGGCQGRHAEFAELKAWLLSKWLWNPDAPYEALVDDFMNGYYGKAAPFVRRYFDNVQALAKTFDPLKNPLRINVDPRVSVDPRTMGLTEEFLDEGEALFRKALAAVSDDPWAWWRVRVTALSIDYCRARREGPDQARYIRELRRVMDHVESRGLGVIRLSNGAGALKDKRIQKEFDEILARGDRPELKVGIFSDHHLGSLKGQGVDLNEKPAKILERTLRFYKDKNVDAIIIAGDFSNEGRMKELRATSAVWAKVFGSKTAGPAKIFVTGNHEKCCFFQFKGRNDLQNPIYTDGLYLDIEKNWMELFGEKWEPIFIKDVKGYAFVGAHWGEWWNEKRMRKFLEDNKKALDPSKPFFYVQHAHPANTCYGAWTWQNSYGSPAEKFLADYPNAVAFSGHTHYSLTDERSVWQGAFTSLGTGSLVQLSMPNGRENGGWARGKPRRMHAMYDGWDSEAMLMKVYAGKMVFERWDFLNMEKIGDDWEVPVLHRHDEKAPFSFARRRARAAAPQFAPDAELTVKDRYWWHLGREKAKEDQIVLTIPQAIGTNSLSRCYEYEVRAVFREEDVERTMCTKRFYQPECHLNEKHLPRTFDAVIGFDEVPSVPFTFVVTPMNSFGVRGKPLTLDYRQPEYRKPPEKRPSEKGTK